MEWHQRGQSLHLRKKWPSAPCRDCWCSAVSERCGDKGLTGRVVFVLVRQITLMADLSPHLQSEIWNSTAFLFVSDAFIAQTFLFFLKLKTQENSFWLGIHYSDEKTKRFGPGKVQYNFSQFLGYGNFFSSAYFFDLMNIWLTFWRWTASCPASYVCLCSGVVVHTHIQTLYCLQLWPFCPLALVHLLPLWTS